MDVGYTIGGPSSTTNGEADLEGHLLGLIVVNGRGCTIGGVASASGFHVAGVCLGAGPRAAQGARNKSSVALRNSPAATQDLQLAAN